jgi:hypothetical protein
METKEAVFTWLKNTENAPNTPLFLLFKVSVAKERTKWMKMWQKAKLEKESEVQKMIEEKQ